MLSSNFRRITLLLLLVVLFSTGVYAEVKGNANTSRGKLSRQFINISLPVNISKCSICHRSLDKENYETVRITHGKHLEKGIKCQSCHIEYPHEPGKLNKPPMETCFTCHGLMHGKQGQVAPAACNVCHPKSFNLLPEDHKKPWQIWKSKSQCILCHQQTFCITCHKTEEQAIVARMKFKPPSVSTESYSKIINISDNIKISKCSSCHNNLDRVEYANVRFYHSKHFEKGIKCNVCHQEFPHKSGYVIRPEMKVCITCHGLNHGKQRQLAPSECLKCHRAGLKPKPKSHNSEWVKRSPFRHKLEAKKDRGACSACHNQKFCDNCHEISPIPHRSDWKKLHGKTVVKIAKENPASASTNNVMCFKCHVPEKFCAKCHKGVVFPHIPTWRKQHGKKAVSVGKSACFTCHEQSLCQKCHKGIEMPHKIGWLEQHKEYLKRNKVINKCLECHVKERACVKCHSAHQVKKQAVNTYPIQGVLR